MGRLTELHSDYRGEVPFLFVHIADARHGVTARLSKQFAELGLTRETPTNRLRRTRLGAELLALPFPCLLDTEDARVCGQYAAFPQKLIVLDADGRVAHVAQSSFWDFGRIRDSLEALAALH